MEVARADLPASLALVAYSYDPLLHEWRVCPDNPSADASLGDSTQTARPTARPVGHHQATMF